MEGTHTSSRMNDLPLAARFYIALIFGLGLGVAFLAVPGVLTHPALIFTTLALMLLNALLDYYPVRLYTNEAHNSVEITVSIAIKMASILLVPLPVVVLSAFGGTLLAELWLRRVWYRLVFNVGAMTLNCLIIAILYTVIHQPNVPIFGSPQNLLALAVLGISDIAVNGFLISTVIALATKSPIDYIWRQTFKPAVVHDLTMLPLGVFIYILWQYEPFSVVLAALPLFVMRYSYQLVADLGRQTREALYALARVLDERDEHTSQHSQQVAEHAGLIARALDLGPEEVEVVMRAAALHDIGKVGMRNDILFKPEGLTPEEREQAKRHALIGGELLQKFPLFEKGAVYVRHHHERWDGKGYPDGLAGDAIPLGARILTVADSFQAMTETRPYRQPMTEQEAAQELLAGSGTQFDPKVIDAFFRAKGFVVPAPRRIERTTSETVTASG